MVHAAVDSVATNITVDDNLPDPLTGNQIVYSPGQWAVGQVCSSCSAQPDKAKAFEHSWHDTTSNMKVGPYANATFEFTGTAIYVYGILCHGSKLNFTTTSDVYFSIDDQLSGKFSYHPDGIGDFTYDKALFSVDSLAYAPHVLVIENGKGSRVSSLLLLDYLVYTIQKETPLNTNTVLSAPRPLPTYSSMFYPQPTQQPAAPSSSARLAISTFALTIIFGTLLGIVCISVCVYLCTRRRKKYGMQKANFPLQVPSLQAPGGSQETVCTDSTCWIEKKRGGVGGYIGYLEGSDWIGGKKGEVRTT